MKITWVLQIINNVLYIVKILYNSQYFQGKNKSPHILFAHSNLTRKNNLKVYFRNEATCTVKI